MSIIGGDKRPMHDVGDASKLQQENLAMAKTAMQKMNAVPAGSGLFHTKGVEPTCNPVRAPAEKWLTSPGAPNAAVRIGKDRPHHITSGYGAKGATGCSTIDIVAGMGAKHNTASGTGPRDGEYLNPSPHGDAARILCTAMTDVDTNFRLDPGTIGSSVARSACAMKADAIRLMGADGGIKLVTGKDDGVEGAGYNARGGKIKQPAPGIELIAGNNSEPKKAYIRIPEFKVETIRSLQPVAMADNVRDCLQELCTNLQQFQSHVYLFMTNQIIYNANNNIDLLRPWVAAVGTPATVSQIVNAWVPDVPTRYNWFAWEANYLVAGSYKYVGSHNVRVT